MRIAPDRFSKSQVVRAGKLIAGTHPSATEELIEAFRVAHRWREAHSMPMRNVRYDLGRLSAKFDPGSVTAGRLKRMSSIRRKLKRGNRTLYQIQDICGCRAIMTSMAQVRQIADAYVEGRLSRHELVDQDDYITAPKVDGYRSHHLVFRFDGPDQITGGNRLVVEVQLRSRMQHAWATAVEAVGFVRKENLKAGEGSSDWLRLFQLMSAEIAVMERCPVPSSCPTREAERRAEIRDLDAKLGAIKRLESYNQAIRYAEDYAGLKGQSYLIRYDIERQEVAVTPFSQYRRAAEQYLNTEMFSEGENAVLVEVDGVDELRAAYPNYFLDVRAFANRLKIAVHGSAFSIPAAADPKISRPTRWGDLSFLRNWRK